MFDYDEIINIHTYKHWVLKIDIEEEVIDGNYIFTSPDVPGLLVVSKDRQIAWDDIPESVRLIRELKVAPLSSGKTKS